MVQIDDLRNYSLGLKGVTEDIKWGHDLCFLIGGKMFLVIGLDTQPVTASFKSYPEQFDLLIQQTGYSPAPYMARHHWIFTDDISRLSFKEWEKFILQSYHLVIGKLPKRVQADINNSDA